MKKKIIVIVISILVIASGVILFLLTNKKETKTTSIEDKKLAYLDLSKVESEIDKINLVKDNVVRITNKINDQIKIIGSGFFTSDGYLITNSHVVDIKGDITVTYPNGKTTTASIISNDISSDIAILDVKDIKVLALEFSETLNLKVADTLYAIGYPLNLEGEATVSKGILSARRSIAGIEYLQTDATIDNGSSGGPLINTLGKIVGMNSLSSNNSNINLALSTETIENTITKLKNNPQVNYITGERPQNALGNILREVGYTELDIYHEWDIINEIYNLHIGVDKNNNKEETNNKETRVLDDNSFAKSISITGYSFGFKSREYSYKFHLENGEDSLKISVTPESAKATYKIIGNGNFKLGSNIVTVVVTAENGSKTTYTFYVMKPVNELDGIVAISCNPGRFESKVYLDCSFLDSRGDSLYNSDYPMLVANTITANAYVKVLTDTESTETINGQKVRYLKAYNFKAKSSTNTANIKDSELRSLLTDEDYNEEGIANLYFKITINTFKNGSFSTATSPYELKK